MNRKLEICCYTVESGILAEKSGADRIELCDNFSEGGTTPSYAAIEYSVRNLKIPVNVMIRPRGGDFLYSDLEYELIKEDVSIAKKLKAKGVVIGFLKENGEIDIERTAKIVESAKPLEVTFHRAFDMCREPLKALEELKRIGIKRILTSGAKYDVEKGIDLLSELVIRAENDIIIMPGGGVSDKNIEDLILKTGAKEFHSASKKFEKSKMNFFNKDISMGGVEDIDEFRKLTLDSERVKKIVNILKKHSY